MHEVHRPSAFTVQSQLESLQNIKQTLKYILNNSNISNYSIFLREPENLLFAYWQCHRTDFSADRAKMANDPKTQDWWKLTDPCQTSLASRKDGEKWSMMEDVFHTN